MDITEVTVSYGLTQSLPEYCNVKPMVTLKATVDPRENPDAVRRELFALARAYVEAEIDDALERHDKPALYDPAPRYQVIRTRQERGYREPDWTPLENVVAIIPNAAQTPAGDWNQVSYGERRGLRHAHALRVATQAAEERGARVIDCWDGELSRLPARPLIETAATEDDGGDERIGAF